MHPKITVEHLTKRFKGHMAVDDLSFQVKEGDIFAMLGANGAGKTTTINMLTTLMKPTSGRIMIDRHDIAERRFVRKEISVTGQFASLDEELTGHENMLIIGRLHHLDRATALKRTGQLLAQFDLTAAADKQVRTYSGGMRRRLDIAVSLVANPNILFLDEPTTGIDPQNRLKLWKQIRRLRDGGTTIFLTTQYLEEAEELADDVVIMNHGKIIAQGEVGELKQKLPQSKVSITFKNECDQSKLVAEFTKNGCGTITESSLPLANEIKTVDKVKTLNQLVTITMAARIVPANIEIVDASLEDVYLQMVEEGV